MFTGIIEKKAKILSINGGKFEVENVFDDEKLIIGQSIAHDGTCMTLEKINEDSWEFFVMEESFKKTNFSTKKTGDFFNIERCLKIGDRLDGHMVSGHVDSTGKVDDINIVSDGSKILKIKFSSDFKNLVIDKGSVTINGVSLTVIESLNDFLIISLIPLTQDITNLGDLEIGDTVNLEFDMIGKYVNKLNS